MKKRIFALAAAVSLMLSVSAHAASPRAVLVLPGLTFSGTTATCTVRINGNVSSDVITASVELLEEGSGDSVDNWNVSGLGYVYFVETASVTKGNEYTLAVDAVVNSTVYPTATVTSECP